MIFQISENIIIKIREVELIKQAFLFLTLNFIRFFSLNFLWYNKFKYLTAESKNGFELGFAEVFIW